MNENWFTSDEVNEFFVKLPSLMLKESEDKNESDDDIQIISIEEFSKKNKDTAQDSGLELPPHSGICNTEQSDALRALGIYTPESSQEKLTQVVPPCKH